MKNSVCVCVWVLSQNNVLFVLVQFMICYACCSWTIVSQLIRLPRPFNDNNEQWFVHFAHFIKVLQLGSMLFDWCQQFVSCLQTHWRCVCPSIKLSLARDPKCRDPKLFNSCAQFLETSFIHSGANRAWPQISLIPVTDRCLFCCRSDFKIYWPNCVIIWRITF